MKLFAKPIFTGFAPNSTAKDVGIALSYLLFPWKWFHLKKGPMVTQGETMLQDLHKVAYAQTFDSGRTALGVALEALGVGDGDEVLVQAYTCIVVINAIIWRGALPVYVDVLDDFTMDPADAAAKVTSKTKAIIIQHTFGAPAQTTILLSLARKYNLKSIEDCAHALGVTDNGKITGTMADIGMLSFGTDKSISCGRGGALITNNDYLATAINNIHNALPQMPTREVLRHLAHWPIFYVAKPLYNLCIGKAMLALTKKLRFTHRIISPEEKKGKPYHAYPAQMPNSLAAILVNQLSLLTRKHSHRKRIAKIYEQHLKTTISQPLKGHPQAIPLRYPLLVRAPKKLHAKAKKQGILLGDWYQTVVAPNDIQMEATQYQKHSCKNAEALAYTSINLPTHEGITQRDAERISAVVNQYIISS